MNKTPHRLSIALIVVMMAALACNASSGPATPPITLTLGGIAGSVTAPAIIGTATFTPIPGVTQAAAATSLIPAPTVQAAQCPAPGAVSLPNEPPTFADYATTINNYLAQGGSVGGLEAALTTWGGLGGLTGELIATHDLTGDQIPEVVVAVRAPAAQFPNAPVEPPGDLYIFGCANGGYAVLYGDYSTPDRPTPDVIEIADINHTGLEDVVYTTWMCGAHTCFYNVHTLEWNPAASVFSDLMPDDESVPSATVTVEDIGSDGSGEIVVVAGGIGSLGAGPQRIYQDIYSWNGTLYAKSETRITTPEDQWYPIHFLQDADAAAESGDTTTAVNLYQKVIDAVNPPTWSLPETEVPELKAYARYRLMITHVVMGEGDAARGLYDALFAEYDADPGKPGAGFAALADAFWQAFTSSNSIQAGCLAVQQYAEANPDSYSILNQFGYANRQYAPADLCPFED